VLRPRRNAILLACALAGLVCCASAQGAQTLGGAFPNTQGAGCGGGTYVQTDSDGNRYAAPFDGVITSWTNEGFSEAMKFKVARLGGGSAFDVIAEDGPHAQANGVRTTNLVRIPVRQGDVIGYYTPATYCFFNGTAGDAFSTASGDVGAGAAGFFDSTSPTGRRLPIEATIERDGDNDGYGDETQDACPTSASTHGACPLPTTLGMTFSPEPTLCDDGTWVVTGSPGVVHAAPADGVITSWSHQAAATVGGTVEFEVLRPTGGSTYLSVGEDGPRTPAAGTLNTWNARIPIRQGDKIGLTAPGVACRSSSSNWSLGSFGTDLAPGATGTTSGSSSRMLDVSAVLEADADSDGFGDTTQDLCPTDPSTQGQCPVDGPPADDGKCEKAKKKLQKAKAKLKKLKRDDAAAKKIKGAKAKVKKAKKAVRKAC